MGLFNFLKKKKEPEVIEPKGSGSEITIKMYVKGVEVPIESNPVNTEHTEYEIMPTSYHQTIAREIKPLENTMISFAIASREKHDIDDSIKILEGFVESYIALKDKCYSLGQDYIQYFYENWARPKEKHGKTYTYAQPFMEELDELRQKRDIIFDKEQKIKKELINLDERLLLLLTDNPGILQTEVYKKFDSVIKEEVSSKLYFWEKDGKIKRTKSGRTYTINVI